MNHEESTFEADNPVSQAYLIEGIRGIGKDNKRICGFNPQFILLIPLKFLPYKRRGNIGSIKMDSILENVSKCCYTFWKKWRIRYG